VENRTYINILTDTLKRKTSLLEQLIALSSEQERIISSEIPDMDRLDSTFSEKEVLITQLNQLDDGFEKVYQHVKEALQTDKEQLKEQILKLQELIRSVTEKSTQLQVIEHRNKSRFQLFFAGKKKEIRNFKVSSKTADSYYKSVLNSQPGESYFLDKKK
jgi:flagellar biosynthesis/type III secretory pathway chaperone